MLLYFRSAYKRIYRKNPSKTSSSSATTKPSLLTSWPPEECPNPQSNQNQRRQAAKRGRRRVDNKSTTVSQTAFLGPPTSTGQVRPPDSRSVNAPPPGYRGPPPSGRFNIRPPVPLTSSSLNPFGNVAAVPPTFTDFTSRPPPVRSSSTGLNPRPPTAREAYQRQVNPVNTLTGNTHVPVQVRTISAADFSIPPPCAPGFAVPPPMSMPVNAPPAIGLQHPPPFVMSHPPPLPGGRPHPVSSHSMPPPPVGMWGPPPGGCPPFAASPFGPPRFGAPPSFQPR